MVNKYWDKKIPKPMTVWEIFNFLNIMAEMEEVRIKIDTEYFGGNPELDDLAVTFITEAAFSLHIPMLDWLMGTDSIVIGKDDKLHIEYSISRNSETKDLAVFERQWVRDKLNKDRTE